jgi:hypothetical protein
LQGLFYITLPFTPYKFTQWVRGYPTAGIAMGRIGKGALVNIVAL